ncbi:MAG: asparaginase [Firmicutes bacterium]|nr:asparaginase [Bacillota bacterium]
MKKKILLIGTGGTIACKQTEDGLAPSFTSEELLGYIPEAEKFCEVDAVQICNLDSTNICPQHWSLISHTVEDHYDQYDGFVVCHGTDTLAYTAAALSYMIQDSAKPVVVTGAQKPINAVNTDARVNLFDSLLYASDEGSHGVVLVFDGKVIAGTRAKKERAKSYNAFSSINYPCLAVIQDGRLIRYIPSANPRWRVRFYHNMDSRVYVLKFTPGLDPQILTWIFENADGVVFESFGVGGIPEYLLEKLEELMENHPNRMVIVATQVVHEGSDMMVYQVGKKVKQELNLLETYDMTLEAAVSKAMWILASQHIEIEERKEAFYKPVNHDLTMHFKEEMQ